MVINTINKEEIQKFDRLAKEWWNPDGNFKPLHKFNPIRLEYIKNNIINDFNIKKKDKPLSNLDILDIGCGGGLLTEPLCRLGGNITGIDASEKNIKMAKLHAKKNKLKINYINGAPENLKFKVGENLLVKYKAKNLSDAENSGTATFNVLPEKVGPYFIKTECFCFEKQTLKPNEKQEFVLTFFLDPKVVDDNKTKNISDVTLSFTFFASEFYEKEKT